MMKKSSVKNSPAVVCLCGSTKFKEDFELANKTLTMLGYIVLAPGFFVHTESTPITPEQKKALDELHFRKIDMSDAVVVVNKNNYIGESTSNEIEYARSVARKPVSFMYVPKQHEDGSYEYNLDEWYSN